MKDRKMSFPILVLFLIINSGMVLGEITIETINSKVNISGQNPYLLKMDENNNSFENKTQLFKIKYDDDESCTTLKVDFIEPATFENEIKDCVFSSLQSFDYENSNQRSYLFQIISTKNENDKIDIRLKIQNIDDEPPVVGSFKCEFDEETDYDVSSTNCVSTVTDPDGWLNEIKFHVIPGTSGNENEDEIFSLEFRETPGDLYSSPVYMYPKEKLKYNQTNFYIFSVTAEDGAGHISEENSAIINVNDLRNTYPVWTLLTKFKEFQEEQSQSFEVKAIDGDTGINEDICYYKVKEDLSKDYISVDEISGRVDVKPIDRDEYDLTFYKWEIEACVCNLNGSWCTTDEVTFVIDDIDDNPPQIIKNIYKNGSEEVFDQDEEKIIQLYYLENYSGSYNFSTTITDIDTGINAQFKVNLEKYGEEKDIDYTEAYMVVPGVGYRTGTFQISVKNNEYLDFEDDVWKTHKYYVVSRGDQNPEEMNDKILISVNLIDYNDEYPIFEESSYFNSINETVPQGYHVITTSASDRDAEDTTLKMNIVGSYAEERLEIDSNGVITVKKDGSFDYDILKSIYFQVTATDNADHVTSVPVTIYILDVNNKAPVIDPVMRLSVEENQKNGVALNVTITASDVDTTANLKSYINWDETKVTKTNSYIDITDEIREAMNFLKVESTQTKNGTGLEIKLVVANNNEDNPNKPDFELFDTLYLAITVEDLNTDPDFEDQRTTTSTILISITDINDNPPSFPDSNNVDRSAIEAASIGASVGFIKAIDLDTVNSVLYYYCTAEEEKYDWVEVNETSGALTVKNEGIDADIPLYNFSYKCWAYDGLYFSEPLEVLIQVVDTNSKNPVISEIGVLDVEEKSPPDTNVSYIYTSDKDRDAPFHTVTCKFQTTDGNIDTTLCAQNFYFTEDNTIMVTNGGDSLNRDKGPANYSCSIECIDNQYNERSQGIRRDTKSFIIMLNDVNDNEPKLVTNDLSCSENLDKNENIGEIWGKDIDAGKNAEIDFTILSVINNENGKDYKDLFEIVEEDDYVFNATIKRVHLVATDNLKNHYGKYEMQINLKDRGVEPLESNGTIQLTINKFNYKSPEIKFPVDNEVYRLFSSQTPGEPLRMFKSESNLSNFQATDGVSETCSKWDVRFTLDQNDADIFLLTQGDIKCQSQLQINDDFSSKVVLQNRYPLTITASVKEGTQEKDEAPYSSSVSITVIFYDNQFTPSFPENKTWKLDLVEANTTQVEELPYPAYYDIDDTGLQIYYYLVGDGYIKSIIDIDEHTGTLSVIEKFYYDDNQTFQFQILASNDSTIRPCEDSTCLDVQITVLSSNRRYPTWKKSPYFGAVMPDFLPNSLVLTAQAHDDDYIDQGNLICKIISDFERDGVGIDNIDEPFYLESSNDAGKIYLNFRVETSMSGSFKFNISVEDHQDPWLQGPHKSEANVTIFIITSENTVDFRFLNEKTEVYDREVEMLQIITEVIGYQAYTQTIDVDQSVSGITVARLYFIKNNNDSFTLINRETILGIVGNVNIYATLSSRLRKEQQLILTNFESTNTKTSNTEAVLRAWLTGVAVILGTLVLILTITLILKIRQLNRRISKLTTKKFGSQDSGLNRLGVTAPTTNKHTIEGSNPVYKKENLKNMSDLDTRSVRSGDSELIGVEENPEFDYNFNSPDKTTYL
ncbi:protocadherin Fat 4-like [Diorhabda carinulata]|uniref:protocadherin Fat 4-like n=1 Tax=Diorhabda carinulata TaxID=1163345 RepID=UPI0025A1D5AE|nr:protocadherin Fat 4-like [Diorhabda carinulata]